MFVEGEIYKEREICQQLGGSPVQNMPMKNGRVTCVFIPDIKDDDKGHYYIQVAAGKNSIKAALTLMEQPEGVPAFLRGMSGSPKYIGLYTAVQRLMSVEDIEYYRYSDSFELDSILLLHKVEAAAEKINKATVTNKNSENTTLKLKGKWCSSCKNTKEHDQFFKSKKNGDGFTNWCRDCLDNYHQIK